MDESLGFGEEEWAGQSNTGGGNLAGGESKDPGEGLCKGARKGVVGVSHQILV